MFVIHFIIIDQHFANQQEHPGLTRWNDLIPCLNILVVSWSHKGG